MRLFHLASAVILTLAHGFFLFRGFYLLHRGARPAVCDRLARNLTRICLPLTFFSGLPAGRPYPLLHLLPALLIIILTPLNFLLRRTLFRTKKWPWLLPLANFLLILWAGIDGFWRG